MTSASRREGPLRIVYLGDARDEKGFQLLSDLVAALADRLFAELRARFGIQANISVAGNTPTLWSARERLAVYPATQVELITQQLALSTFHDLLRDADIVVVPYDRQTYQRRRSGILIQARAVGRVVVVPSHTWMGRQIDPAAGVAFASDAGLSGAVLAAAERWPNLSKRAQANAPGWQAQHNASLFISKLVSAS
jgi:hypothetical protein